MVPSRGAHEAAAKLCNLLHLRAWVAALLPSSLSGPQRWLTCFNSAAAHSPTILLHGFDHHWGAIWVSICIA